MIKEDAFHRSSTMHNATILSNLNIKAAKMRSIFAFLLPLAINGAAVDLGKRKSGFYNYVAQKLMFLKTSVN